MNNFTKEDCLKAIEKIEKSYGCDMAYYDLYNERDLIKHLINEHFELKEKYEKLEKSLDKACEEVMYWTYLSFTVSKDDEDYGIYPNFDEVKQWKEYFLKEVAKNEL